MGADVEGETRLLRAWGAGDKNALDELIPLVYTQLRGLAARFLASEWVGHTLRPTARVHEAYLRLADSNLTFNDRLHSLSAAAEPPGHREQRRHSVAPGQRANRQRGRNRRKYASWESMIGLGASTKTTGQFRWTCRASV
jgi:hypothetical protein